MRLWGCGGEGVAHRSGCLHDSSKAASFELAVVGLLTEVDVVLAVAHHTVDELSEPSCDSKDGNAGIFVARDATVGGAECGLATLEGARGHPERASNTVGAESIASLAPMPSIRVRSKPAARHSVVRALWSPRLWMDLSLTGLG